MGPSSRAKAAVITSESGRMFELLQRARTELHHRAHVYAHTKETATRTKDDAAEELERAALTMALLAAQYGLKSDCARPAGKAGEVWRNGLDPETALREASKVVKRAVKRDRKGGR